MSSPSYTIALPPIPLCSIRDSDKCVHCCPVPRTTIAVPRCTRTPCILRNLSPPVSCIHLCTQALCHGSSASLCQRGRKQRTYVYPGARWNGHMGTPWSAWINDATPGSRCRKRPVLGGTTLQGRSKQCARGREVHFLTASRRRWATWVLRLIEYPPSTRRVLRVWSWRWCRNGSGATSACVPGPYCNSCPSVLQWQGDQGRQRYHGTAFPPVRGGTWKHGSTRSRLARDLLF